MAIREDSHQRCSLAVRTPMAAAAISVQMIATCPRPTDCSGISAPIIKPAAGMSVARGPQGATRRSATSPDGSKMWLAMMCPPACGPLAITCAAWPLAVPALSRDRVLPPCSRHQGPWGREKTNFLSPWRIEQHKDNIVYDHQHYLCPAEPVPRCLHCQGWRGHALTAGGWGAGHRVSVGAGTQPTASLLPACSTLAPQAATL